MPRRTLRDAFTAATPIGLDRPAAAVDSGTLLDTDLDRELGAAD